MYIYFYILIDKHKVKSSLCISYPQGSSYIFFKNVGEHWLVRNVLRNVRTFWNGIAYCLSHLLPFIFNDHCNKRMKRVLAWFHDWDMSCGHVTVVNYAFLVYSHFVITMVLWSGFWNASRISQWKFVLNWWKELI